MEFALQTDVGRVRQHNEDTCAADEGARLFVVCDGMGGAAAGEIAAQMAARTFLQQARFAAHEPAERRLRLAALAANRAVYGESRRNAALHGMGTTLVGLHIDREAAQAWTANVGDSRCYRLRDGRFSLLTVDHSFVEEQVQLGQLTREEALASPLRNVITRAVGSQREVKVDVQSHSARKGDVYLLCSDGLIRGLQDDEIASVLAVGGGNLQDRAQALIDAANRNGGIDNITVVLVTL